MHLLSGPHFVHTSSVILPAASLSPAPKMLSLKIPTWGEAGWLFNTLQPPEDRASDIDGVVNHRDWITVTLTQLSSFLFPLTYPLFFFSFSRAGSPTLTTADCQSGWGPLSTWTFLFHCDSRSLIPPLLALSVSVCKWHHGKTVVEHPGRSQSILYTLPPTYTLGLPQQHPATPPTHYITGLSLITCSIDSCTRMALSRLSPHTHIQKKY